MKIRKIASLGLAAALQVLPLTRVFVAATPATGSSFAIIATWIAGVAALLGGVDAVSGASTTVTSPTAASGTNGVAFSYRITTGPQSANTFAAAPLPSGLVVSTTTGRISGTPTVSGVFTILLTASDSGQASRTVKTNLTLTIVASSGGGGATAPAITTQPVSQSVTAGANVSFSVVASGTAPLSYQWKQNGVNVSGGTGATLSLTGVTTGQAGSYTCVVTNVAGSATSSGATLTVGAASVAPAITTQPVSQSVTAGANVSFSVVASGTAPLSYQWRRNGVNVSGGTGATLSLTGVTTGQAGSYTCVVTNVAGSATSSAATLTVQSAAPQATTLTVIIQGQGTVTPNLNSASLTLGQSYTMTATPAAGYEFAGWSGNIQTVQSSSATLTFVMASNLVLQASFVPPPYTAGAGTYNGLFFESDEVRLASAGAFKVHAAGSGNYSAWVKLGYVWYAFSGKLDLNLCATNVITRRNGRPLTVELLVGQGSQAGQISGRVTDGVWSSPLSGGRATGRSPYAGRYTLVIPGLVGDAHIPAGDGYATLSVGVYGAATMSGTLADGSKFMQSAMVTDEGDWPVYVSLYSGKGALVSWMNFTNLSSSDVSGTLVWIKQAGASAVSYPAGFTNETKAVGSLYVSPSATGKALNLSMAEVGFSGGELEDSQGEDDNRDDDKVGFSGGKSGGGFANVVSVNAGSRVVNLSPNALTLTISPALGSFRGQVAEPGTGVVHPFGGVVLQKQNTGYGFMIGVNASSRVVFTAP